jgi:hypothetical protein
VRLKVTWDVITYHSGEIDIDDDEWEKWSEGKPATPDRLAKFIQAGAASISEYLPEDAREWKVDEAEVDERSLRPMDCPARRPLEEREHSIVVSHRTWCHLYKDHPGEHLFAEDD